MLKAKRVYISNYKSAFYPVAARWTVNNIKYIAVFEDLNQLKNYFIGRFINVSFIDKREGKQC